MPHEPLEVVVTVTPSVTCFPRDATVFARSSYNQNRTKLLLPSQKRNPEWHLVLLAQLYLSLEKLIYTDFLFSLVMVTTFALDVMAQINVV
jgi:hypothetical protein